MYSFTFYYHVKLFDIPRYFLLTFYNYFVPLFYSPIHMSEVISPVFVLIAFFILFLVMVKKVSIGSSQGYFLAIAVLEHNFLTSNVATLWLYGKRPCHTWKQSACREIALWLKIQVCFPVPSYTGFDSPSLPHYVSTGPIHSHPAPIITLDV